MIRQYLPSVSLLICAKVDPISLQWLRFLIINKQWVRRGATGSAPAGLSSIPARHSPCVSTGVNALPSEGDLSSSWRQDIQQMNNFIRSNIMIKCKHWEVTPIDNKHSKIHTHKICSADFVHCQWKVTSFEEFVVTNFHIIYGMVLNLYEELNFLPFRTLREIWNIYKTLTISVKTYIWA